MSEKFSPDYVLISQAYAAGHAMMRGENIGHRSDVFLLVPEEPNTERVAAFIVAAASTNLRTIPLLLNKVALAKVSWPKGALVMLLPPKNKDDRKKVEVRAKESTPANTYLMWAYISGPSAKPIGFQSAV